MSGVLDSASRAGALGRAKAREEIASRSCFRYEGPGAPEDAGGQRTAMGVWRSRERITVTELRTALQRLSDLERELEQVKARLRALEAVETKIETAVEMQRLDAEIAPIEAAAKAKLIEAAVRAEAALIEATTPHYPRA